MTNVSVRELDRVSGGFFPTGAEWVAAIVAALIVEAAHAAAEGAEAGWGE